MGSGCCEVYLKVLRSIDGDRLVGRATMRGVHAVLEYVSSGRAVQ